MCFYTSDDVHWRFQQASPSLTSSSVLLPIAGSLCHTNSVLWVADIFIQLVPCDSVNRNKVSIRHSLFFYFPSLTTCFGPYGPSSGEVYNYSETCIRRNLNKAEICSM
jgi:hypothetical protein